MNGRLEKEMKFYGAIEEKLKTFQAYLMIIIFQ